VERPRRAAGEQAVRMPRTTAQEERARASALVTESVRPSC